MSKEKFNWKNVKVKVEKIDNNKLAQRAFQTTVDYKCPQISRKKTYALEHSPMRLHEFWIELHNIPVCVMNQLRTHSVGIDHFALSKRSDRSSTEDKGRWTPTNYSLKMNAQAIINMSKERLCNMAYAPTRKIWKKVLTELSKVDNTLSQFCVPKCVYRNGLCKGNKGDGKGMCGNKTQIMATYSDHYKELML